MKIGVMVESFRAGLDGGLAAAAELGLSGARYASRGESLCLPFSERTATIMSNINSC